MLTAKMWKSSRPAKRVYRYVLLNCFTSARRLGPLSGMILHPVNQHGKQEKGGLELKTNGDGQTSFDGVPLGPMRVQVIATGFQTYGQDFDVKTGKLDVTIRLKRPMQQYSVYDDHSSDKKDPPPPPPNNGDKKPPQ